MRLLPSLSHSIYSARKSSELTRSNITLEAQQQQQQHTSASISWYTTYFLQQQQQQQQQLGLLSVIASFC
jgi:hypothetical protein